MKPRIRVATTQSVAELAIDYRQACDPVERSQRQMVWLIASGRTTKEVAEVTGYHVNWIRTVVHRYNATGIVGDGRHHNPGAVSRRLLSDAQQEELTAELEGLAPDGGQWTSAKVAQWISTRIGRPVGVVRGWDYLQRVRYRLLVPRPRHEAADAQAQEALKKTARHRAAGPSRLSGCTNGSVDHG